jgi:sugar (pentulose or hexulose) kinase
MMLNGRKHAIAAHHEAGHAVVAHMLGCHVKRVSIDEGGGGATLIRWGRGGHRTERQILSNLAGPFSQRRFAPHSRWRSRNHAGFAAAWRDFDNVATLIYDLHGKGRVAEKYRSYMEARAESLVDEHWLRIESVARALMERGSINSDIRTVFSAARA